MLDFSCSTSITGKRWQEKACDDRLAFALSQRLDEPEIVGRLLASRNITLEEAPDFLTPSLKNLLVDPSHLHDLNNAVQRIIQAIEKKEKICIFGDYDVDGATSTALLYRYFKQIDLHVDFYIPDRLQEGYGPNILAIEKLRQSGVHLIITVDCGTTSHAPLKAAENMGLDVIVIDHHIGEPKLPPATAIVNPNRLDQESSCQTLAAVGVSFLLLIALNRTLRQQGYFKSFPEPNLLQFLDLVALGTVCDVMPLQKLNRAFVTQGLKVMAQRQNLGLKTLMDTAGLQEAPSAYHLGFMLGPRINAGGRVGKSTHGVTLLTTDDPALAQKIAQELEVFNRERQAIEAEVLKEARFQAEIEANQNSILIVGSAQWHPGVIGIVAGRLKDHYHRPTLVISFDENDIGKGSGRSIPGIDLGSLIQAARQRNLILAGGGHSMAAGFTIEKSKLEPFKSFLNERIQAFKIDMTPYLTIDGYLSLDSATPELLHKLERLAPYGQGNPTPRFVFSNIRILHAEIVGNSHIKCHLGTLEGSRLQAIAFKSYETTLGPALLNHSGRFFHILGTLKLDSWLGQNRVQLSIEDAFFASEASRQANLL
ncbi:MAG: single-stranded-DNA-specific exonuclease RecJ [Caedibacter sp. 38-128]|nr:single-stranded-DNA-specific exonuclease RecJ [Holosporales bacterium]OJX07198.1 MAG: single-stranded-DNA-specific exonuclease RecJ [Caedibacter sp. 38-128]